MAQCPTSVLAVLSGCSLRCLRRDMGRDLVFEVCVMVPQGLLTHLPRPLGGRVGGAGGRPEGQKYDVLK